MPKADWTITRRAFASTLAGAALLAAAPQKKRILILGGTGYLGPATVEAAKARGHELTLFNRGKTRPGLFPQIETLLGDRDPKIGEGLNALRDRTWDAVIDNSGNVPRMVTASAQLLGPRVKQYIYISSISAYADMSIEGQDESGRLATTPDPTVEQITAQTYGALKALSEKASEEALPGRAAVVRPGYIVGPDDPSGRFTYWPVRIDRGGEVLAPGSARGPGAVRRCARSRPVAHHAGGAGHDGSVQRDRSQGPHGVGRSARGLPQSDEDGWHAHLGAGGVDCEKGRGDLPHLGAVLRETRGFHRWNCTAAIKAGLTFRPCQQTVADTLRWYKTQDEGGRTKLAGPAPAKEAELLAAWKRESGRPNG